MIKFNSQAERAASGVTTLVGVGMLFGSVLPGGAFTQADADRLEQRLKVQAYVSESREGLLGVAEEMNIYARIGGDSYGYGPAFDVVDSTVRVDFNGSFGVGDDYFSLDLILEKVKSPIQYVGASFPLFTFGVDEENRGLLGAYDEDGFRDFSFDLTAAQETVLILSVASLVIVGGISY